MVNDFNLTFKQIESLFSKTIFDRGKRYFKARKVEDVDYDDQDEMWWGEVIGSEVYTVSVYIEDTVVVGRCSCPAYDKYQRPCKHIAAMLLELYDMAETERAKVDPLEGLSEEMLRLDAERKAKQKADKQREKEEEEQRAKEREAINKKKKTDDFIQKFAEPTSNLESQKHPLKVEWILKFESSTYSTSPGLKIEMKVGPQRTYVVKDIRGFLLAVDISSHYFFAKNFTYYAEEHTFTQADKALIDLLNKAIWYEKSYGRLYQSISYTSVRAMNERNINIPKMLLEEFLDNIMQTNYNVHVHGRTYRELHIHEASKPFSFSLTKTSDEYQVDLSNLKTYYFMNAYGYLLQENNIYFLTEEQQAVHEQVNRYIDLNRTSYLPVSQDQIEAFISQVVPKLELLGNVDIDERIANHVINEPLSVSIYVDREDEEIYVRVDYYYGQTKVEPLSHQAAATTDGPIMIRDAKQEATVQQTLAGTVLEPVGTTYVAVGEELMYTFIYEDLEKLEAVADVYLTNAVKTLLLPENTKPVTSIEVNETSNLLEVSFDMTGVDREEVARIMQAVVEKKKYYRLPSGAFVGLDAEEFESVATVLNEFDVKKSALKDGPITLPLYRGLQLDDVAQKSGSTRYSKQFRRLLNRLKHPEEMEVEVPKSLQADLRDYQEFGFQWLKTLGAYGFGGILADDMGLGKTIQSIAYILSELEEAKEKKPALIVAPASLVYNWKHECEKFAPSLTAEVVTGTPSERNKLIHEGNVDVWITSYHTLRQDIEAYSDKRFSALFLDEAQAIKNHTTKSAKAVSLLHADARFALSGTPIENSVDELWSLFNAVMPNFFPARTAFRKMDQEKIARMIRPFLLRRLKRDVLKELPDKIDTVYYPELTKDQKHLYTAYLERIQKESRESMEEDGFQKSRIKILAGLTRLRQLCCHPSLFLKDYKGESGKLAQLLEVIENAKENGKRMLIFSQFTSMLQVIRAELEQNDEGFFYLDGSTPSKERVALVDRFNQGEADIFLISLKAGNTGLNLTGADTVILYDLWWNPAVEEQAAGRAHRIGQKNVVQVIRLITQGTIEEKIYELQQKKKELIETVIEPGSESASTITEEEIREILDI